jgi:uncharacterized membrane protein HdeD (DUF308 family)
MTIAERFRRTPTWSAVVIELAIGLMALSFGVLNAVGARTSKEDLLTLGLGAVGGLAIGLALGMTQHLLVVRQGDTANTP